MALIDDRGRLFGKVNLVDFGLIAMFLVLIPLGYAAYRLLRTPAPRLLAATPNPLPYKKGEQRIRVTGENFRPFLRATVGNADAKAFLVERRDAAEVVFEGPAAGSYDLALFDFAEEIARLKNAVTIAAPPTPPVQIVGHLVGDDAAVGRLTPGTKLADAAPAPLEVIAVQPAADRRRAAMLRTSCDGAGPCTVGGGPVVIGRRLDLHVPGSADVVGFVVDEVRVDALWAEAHVLVFGLAEVLELMKPGDVDTFLNAEVAVPAPRGVTGAAVVRSVEGVRKTDGSLALHFSQNLSDSVAGFSGGVAGTAQLPLTGRSAVLGVPVERTGSGLRYRNQYVRPGSALTFVTGDYLLRAVILRVIMPNGTPTDATSQ